MNRKTKKQITIVTVLLFFLAAGLWYMLRNGGFSEKQENTTELVGVLDSLETEPTGALSGGKESVDNSQVQPETLVVYVCGAVNTPGIYTLAADSRLYEAVALAGGFSAEADPAYHNLARNITDGERIYILSCTETKALDTEQQVAGEDGALPSFTEGAILINLNTATVEQLMELPGIGEARAADILEYRARIGQFTDIEEIMNVSGIGEAMFEKMKDKITVK